MCTFNNRVVVPETLSFRESAFIVERGGEGKTVFLLVMGERKLPCEILRFAFVAVGAFAERTGARPKRCGTRIPSLVAEDPRDRGNTQTNAHGDGQDDSVSARI